MTQKYSLRARTRYLGDTPSARPTHTSSKPARTAVPHRHVESRGQELFATLGERWNYLIVREVFFGVRRFGELQRALGIASNVLTSRLEALVDLGVLERCQYRPDKEWFDYSLTQDAKALVPAWITIAQWAEAHLPSSDGAVRGLRHTGCGQLTKPILACGACGEPIKARDLEPENDRWGSISPSLNFVDEANLDHHAVGGVLFGATIVVWVVGEFSKASSLESRPRRWTGTGWSERVEARRRQLDGEREAVQASADLSDGRGVVRSQREARPGQRGPVTEQAYCADNAVYVLKGMTELQVFADTAPMPKPWPASRSGGCEAMPGPTRPRSKHLAR